MKLILLYFLILIVLLLLINTTENMTDIIPYNNVNNNLKINFNIDNKGIATRDINDRTTEIVDNRLNFISISPSDPNIIALEDNTDYNNNYSLLKNDSKNCCLVNKDIYNDYNFEKLYGNEQCNVNSYDLNENRQLLIDGVNGWDNNYCANNLDNQPLGSCRNNNKECVNFINKTKCESINGLEWSEKPCSVPILKKVSFKEYDLSQV
jgi:hypothetical protein